MALWPDRGRRGVDNHWEGRFFDSSCEPALRIPPPVNAAAAAVVGLLPATELVAVRRWPAAKAKSPFSLSFHRTSRRNEPAAPRSRWAV
jgi:hypothetical protein